MKPILFSGLVVLASLLFSCNKEKKDDELPVDKKVFYSVNQFSMGADLSYVNQILDHGGTYKDSGEIRNPYRIFKSNGANMVRLRLWHNPTWTKDVYGELGTQLYNDLKDVEKSIAAAKAEGMAVLLDLHYSDTWADPEKQVPPVAWKDIKELDVLKDSVYQYTKTVMTYLKSKNLFPEMIQIGNEINCGMMITGTTTGFPQLNCCDGLWLSLGEVINSGIQAVRDVSSDMSSKPQILLHVADPKNLSWWFGNIISKGKVTDFDIIGFSYYPLWHTEIAYANLPALVSNLKTQFDRKIMILETAYPWSTSGADQYNNMMGSQAQVGSFEFTKDGQKAFLIDLTQKMITAGACGIVYWEPAWITSQMKDLWGTGSSWENCTLFDFEGNSLPSFSYMTCPYSFPNKK